MHFSKPGEHVSARVLSATKDEGQTKGENPIKLVTDGINQGNQNSYMVKADTTGDSVNGEDAIDVDDNDGKLAKSSDLVSETTVSDKFASCFFHLLLCSFWVQKFL